MKKIIIITALIIPIISFCQFDGRDTLHAVNINATGVIYGDVDGFDLIPEAELFMDSSTATVISLTDEWVQIKNFTEDFSVNGITASGDTIFVSETGKYDIVFDPSMYMTSGGNTNFEIGYSLNGVLPLKRHRSKRFVTGNDTGNMIIDRTLDVSAGEYVYVMVRNLSNTNNIVFLYGALQITKK